MRDLNVSKLLILSSTSLNVPLSLDSFPAIVQPNEKTITKSTFKPAVSTFLGF